MTKRRLRKGFSTILYLNRSRNWVQISETSIEYFVAILAKRSRASAIRNGPELLCVLYAKEGCCPPVRAHSYFMKGTKTNYIGSAWNTIPKSERNTSRWYDSNQRTGLKVVMWSSQQRHTIRKPGVFGYVETVYFGFHGYETFLLILFEFEVIYIYVNLWLSGSQES